MPQEIGSRAGSGFENQEFVERLGLNLRAQGTHIVYVSILEEMSDIRHTPCGYAIEVYATFSVRFCRDSRSWPLRV